jgi:hypothetical protein
MTTQYRDMTFEEIRIQVLSKLTDPDVSHVAVTRAHEYLFGTTIPHAVGVHAPEGKIKVIGYKVENNGESDN